MLNVGAMPSSSVFRSETRSGFTLVMKVRIVCFISRVSHRRISVAVEFKNQAIGEKGHPTRSARARPGALRRLGNRTRVATSSGICTPFIARPKQRCIPCAGVVNQNFNKSF